MPNDRPSPAPRLPLQLLVVGTEMVSFTVAGLILDWLLNSMPWATVVLTVLGFLAAFMHLVRQVNSRNTPGRPAGSDR